MDEMQDEAMQDGRDAGLDERGGVALIKCGLNESEDGSGAKRPAEKWRCYSYKPQRHGPIGVEPEAGALIGPKIRLR